MYASTNPASNAGTPVRIAADPKSASASTDKVTLSSALAINLVETTLSTSRDIHQAIPATVPEPGRQSVVRFCRRWLFRMVLLLVTILTSEAVLQVAAGVSPRIARATSPPNRRAVMKRDLPPVMIPDPILRHRGNPNHPAHDRLGFHNVTVPSHIDVVALGDSQTYGPIDKSREAWPALLAGMTGKTVYNMGIGGWDAVDYLSILDEALARKPETILLGLYFGNDIYGAFRAVYINGVHADLATPGVAATLEALEKTDSMAVALHRLVCAAPNRLPRSDRRKRVMFVRRIVSQRSRLYGAFRWIKDSVYAGLFPTVAATARADRVWREQRAWARRHAEQAIAFEYAGFRTVLRPAIRYTTLNLRDPRIEEGLEITLRVLDRCAARCRDQGVAFGVILIPTKESVFAEPGDVDVSDAPWSRLVASEHEVRDQVTEFLTARGIPFRDALDTLRQSLEDSVQPYPITRDGHPNTAGHRAMARSAVDLLADLHELEPRMSNRK